MKFYKKSSSQINETYDTWVILEYWERSLRIRLGIETAFFLSISSRNQICCSQDSDSMKLFGSVWNHLSDPLAFKKCLLPPTRTTHKDTRNGRLNLARGRKNPS